MNRAQALAHLENTGAYQQKGDHVFRSFTQCAKRLSRYFRVLYSGLRLMIICE
ncbi:MAG: hypothetical protein GY726_07550 [Proteobacteria bacterium]|nr:hypothetical protein [Pseudomonadota bacterium]